jgi:cysteinyl-tRNA synthetase
MFRLHNTLTHSIEPFTPLQPGKVGLYTCGPTVYNYAHIGNLRTYIFEDILRRVLQYNGYAVNHVMNITDVGHLTDDADSGDDKMEKGAAREQKSVWEIAQFYTDAFRQDAKDLNLLEPKVVCKATDHIQEQIDLVLKLQDRGFTYQTSDGIYFDTSKLSDYGKLARLDIAGLSAGNRVEMGEKKHPTDFALWKFSPTNSKRQMEWNSPWGVGFPGWHIECSAMSLKYLGDHFDIHCGGIDHIPVHHTNEIAQNEAALGHSTVNYWLHGEFLLTNDERMAKSEGNFLTVPLLKENGYDPLAYRYFCFSAHYRSKLNFTFEALDGAQNALQNLRRQIQTWGKPTEVDTVTMEQFTQAVNDDLDMPKALAVLWTIVRSDMDSGKKMATVLEMDIILGLHLNQPVAEIPPEVMELVTARETVRQAKQWAESDRLRDEIARQGYQVEDTKEGPRVYRQ